VEIHLPGSPATATGLLARLVGLGAARAGPGEFTARAFFAGRLGLSEARAVADVINADDDAQRRAALAGLDGRTHRLCRAAAGQLTDALATVEASIDLAEENLQLDRPERLAGALRAVATELRQVAREAVDMADETRHVHVALVGRPNVGKSSLVNALAGADRAIVSAMAGTTRDVLSAAMTLGDGAVVLQDAAGFADPADGLTAAADTAARRAVGRADVGCLGGDAADPQDDDAALADEARRLNPDAPRIVLLNKIDLLGDRTVALPAWAPGETYLPVSARTGHGLETVRAELAERLAMGSSRSGAALGLHRQQKEHVLAAADATAAAADRLAACDDLASQAELTALDLRDALMHLGTISGEVVTDDVLERIFARFCVGK